MTNLNQVLSKVAFFTDLDAEGRAFVTERIENKTFAEGEWICKLGDHGDEMYVVFSGSADVTVPAGDPGTETTIASLGSGDYFGEMSLLTGEPRSASVIATAHSEIGVLKKTDFDNAVAKFPAITISMGRVMSQRLQATLQRVASTPTNRQSVASVRRAGKERPAGIALKKFTEQNFSDHVRWLIDHDELDDYVNENKAECESFEAAARSLADRAFSGLDPAALYQVHKALYNLYEEQLRPTGEHAYNQFNPFLLNIRGTLEKRWEQHELERINLDPVGVPEDETAFTRYFNELCERGSMADHPLFDFLENRATRSDLVSFFLSDAAVIVRFCDLVVLSMVGADDDIRGELADNLWDEMGHGRVQERHVHLFENLLEYAGIDLPKGPLSVDQFIGNLDWSGLAGYNFYLFLCLNRRNQLRSLGALGAAESMDPAQYSRVLAGCRRVGFDEVAYYAGHESMDVGHGDHWLKNVLLPLVKKFPDHRHEIVIGAQMRINITIDYYDGLAARFEGR